MRDNFKKEVPRVKNTNQIYNEIRKLKSFLMEPANYFNNKYESSLFIYSLIPYFPQNL